ncbi:MAG: aminoacyl-tRNA hydrolase [Nitrospira sp.]|nr:aminoacyl-tRNA hydrolase [Nitrospira sp.]
MRFPSLLQNLTLLRTRVLSWLKFWVPHTGTGIWRWLRPLIVQGIVWVVSMYRLTLRRVVFIGVTGSCGKTTTKELIDAVLSSQYKGSKNPGSSNVLGDVIRSVLRTRRAYHYCVQEFTMGGIGETIPLEKQCSMFQPQMGVVTSVGDDHISAHGSREAIAAEKGKLIAALPQHGTAILNADDPLVLAMQHRCKGRTLTYGLSPDALLRAQDIHDDWPSRLSLTVLYEGESVRVQTQLCGAHLVPNVLAAMAVGQAMGVSLQSAATALASVAPVPGRMYPIESPDGVTFIRDDKKAPVWTIPPALDYVRRAMAKRKIIILGTLSDYKGDLRATYKRVAGQAVEAADYVFFVGQWASHSLRAKRHADDQALQAFVTVDHLNGFLHGFLQPGDFVFIKGSSRADRLSRIVSAWSQKSSGLPAADSRELDHSVTSPSTNEAPILSTDGTGLEQGGTQLVVGLGNPGKRFAHTPHNVGYRTLELLAESLQATWAEEELGVVARAHVQGHPVLLVKPATEMNRIGPWMRQLADQARLKVQDCLIIQDDLSLQPGVVRNRMSGSSGGHKGVQSVIAAFQSEEIRRIKIGVGMPTEGIPVTRYVLTPFATSQQAIIEKACHTAATRVLEMVKKHSPTELREPD